MKFLVLALCVYAASAAVPSFRGNQPWQFSKATAQAAVPVFQTVAKPVEAVVQPAVQPVVVAKTYINDKSDAYAPIVRSESDTNAQGFNYAYETGNGIFGSATGTLKNVDNTNVVVIQGGYRYIGPEGPVEVTYTADENGFHPEGKHLPVAPPMPEAIIRSLKFIAEHPPKTETVKNF